MRKTSIFKTNFGKSSFKYDHEISTDPVSKNTFMFRSEFILGEEFRVVSPPRTKLGPSTYKKNHALLLTAVPVYNTSWYSWKPAKTLKCFEKMCKT